MEGDIKRIQEKRRKEERIRRKVAGKLIRGYMATVT